VYKQKKAVRAISRRRKAGLVLLFFLAGVVLVCLDRSHVARRRPSQDKSQATIQANDIARYHGKMFRVVHVVDGDTLDVDIADGDKASTRIRLLGIDTPETTDASEIAYFGSDATEATNKMTLGQNISVYLDNDNHTRGYYGRLLAYVKLPDGRFLNEVLLSEGFGYADVRFRHSFYNRYKQLEASARTLKKGLWAGVKREQLPKWLQREKPTLLLGK